MKIIGNVIFLLLFVCLSSVLAFGQDSKVTISFSILDETKTFFADLKKEDIRISQNGKPAEIQTLEKSIDQPIEIMVMIDASASQERTLPNEKKIAEMLIDSILKKDRDKVGVVKFAGEVSLVADLTNDFPNAKDNINKIKIKLPSGSIGGGVVVGLPPNSGSKQKNAGATSMWNSVKQVLEAFGVVKSKTSRQPILLISDGVNTLGDTTIDEAIQSAIKNRIPIFSFGIGDFSYEGVDHASLSKLSEPTCGKAYFSLKEKDIGAAFKEIDQILRSSYQINFVTDTVKQKEKLQNAKIEIVNPELRKRKLQIIQPQGFFLPN